METVGNAISQVFEKAGLKKYSLSDLVDKVVNFIPNTDELGVMSCKVTGATFDERKQILYLTIYPIVVASSSDHVRIELLAYSNSTGWYCRTFLRGSLKEPDTICGKVSVYH